MEWKIITVGKDKDHGVIIGKGEVMQLMKIVDFLKHDVIKVFKIENGKEVECDIFTP
jgi:RecJ-like exonuclease